MVSEVTTKGCLHLGVPIRRPIHCPTCGVVCDAGDVVASWPPEAVNVAGPLPMAPCRNLGEPMGKTVTCTACGGEKTRLKLHVCAVFGECTIDPARPVDKIAYCHLGCPGYQALTPSPPSG